MKNNLSTSRWIRILPVVFVTYSLAYLDRANVGFGTAGGMARDLGISGNNMSLLSGLFFLGYFFFQVPGAYYASKRSTRKMICWSLILWGILAMVTGMVKSFALLLAARFLLGVVESAVFPSMLLLLTRWFTKNERSRANTFLIFGNPVTILWMSIISGYLVQSVGWRWMFILEGFPAIIWAFFWWKLVADRPAEADWLSTDEKKSLEEQLNAEQAGMTPVKNYRAAFKSRIVLLLCLQYFLWSIGVYGFVLWLPSIIKAAPNMGIVETGWLSSFPYLLAIVGMLITSYYSDKSGKRSIFVWPLLLVGAAAFYFSYVAGNVNFWLSFSLLSLAGMMMYAPYGAFFAMIPECLPANVAGGATALINSFGALGAFAGAWLVGLLNVRTAGFSASYAFMAISLLAGAICTIIATKK